MAGFDMNAYGPEAKQRMLQLLAIFGREDLNDQGDDERSVATRGIRVVATGMWLAGHGGLDAMQWAFDWFCRDFGKSDQECLETMWDGIGGWTAKVVPPPDPPPKI
jgi:hypothetical protein